MQALSDILHILLCKDPHSYNMIELPIRLAGKCYYYLECDVAEGQEMPDHIKWAAFADDFKIALDLTNDKEALEFIKGAIKLSQQLEELTEGNKSRWDFITRLKV